MEFRRRLGGFFIFLGILLVVMYVFSDIADAPSCGLLGWGTGLSVVGSLMTWLNPKADRPESGRFGILKRKRDRQAKRDKRKQK